MSSGIDGWNWLTKRRKRWSRASGRSNGGSPNCATLCAHPPLCPPTGGCPPKEPDLFLSLLANDTVTKEMAMLVLYGTEDRPDHGVAMFMSRIRSKTEPHSVKIETINRTGYRLVDRLVWTKTLKLDAVEH